MSSAQGETRADPRVRAVVAAAAEAQGCVEQTAVTLITHLSNWDGHTEGTPAEVRRGGVEPTRHGGPLLFIPVLFTVSRAT